jgi:hypothetical protein
MGIFETFTKRQNRLRNVGVQDVYQYDLLSTAFRTQVIHIWNSAIGVYYRPQSAFVHRPDSPSNKWWETIHDVLAREHGVFALGNAGSNAAEFCREYILQAETSGALDIIEFSFRVIDKLVRGMDQYARTTAQIKQEPDNAIAELNHRFREHGIGYQYVDGELVRIDSQLIHAEAVKPALSLLHEAGFDGPVDEFMGAFDHHRHGRNKEAMAEALKAFESTMKAVCKVRGWSHPANATAIPLVKFLMEKGLIPAELESHFAGLRSAMESGLPTISNRTSRHGQGADPVTIPSHFAAYALHLAASNIVFIVQAHKSLG